MTETNRLRPPASKGLRRAVAALFLLQPLLDVLSYWTVYYDRTALTMFLRFALLAVVGCMGFVLTEKKRAYLCIYGVMAGFWALHAASCFRMGYASFYSDTANYLRLLCLPVFFLSMMTFLRRDGTLFLPIVFGVSGGLLEIILFTALPWLLGHPVYTYELIQVGVMGWFAVSNAQSAIIVLAVPLAVCWGYCSRRYWAFLGLSLLGFALMFLTGTKLTYYAIFIVAGAYIFLFAINLKGKCWRYVLPLLVLAVAALALRGYSPMQVRENMTAYSQQNYQRLVEKGLAEKGKSIESLRELKQSEEEMALFRREMREALSAVYTDPEAYGPLFEDLSERFGLYRVMEAYDYTAEPRSLSNTRLRKSAYARLVWEEQDLLSRFVGFEYSDMLYGDAIYDLENDFPAVFYFSGYLGFGLYMLFFLYVASLVLRGFFAKLREAAAAHGGKPCDGKRLRFGLTVFWDAVGRFLTPQIGAMGMVFLLAVIAAQLSGNVLRRPNVAIYMAAAAACLCRFCLDILPQKQRK